MLLRSHLKSEILGQLNELKDVMTQRFQAAGSDCNPKGGCGVSRTWDTLVPATLKVTQRVDEYQENHLGNSGTAPLDF